MYHAGTWSLPSTENMNSYGVVTYRLFCALQDQSMKFAQGLNKNILNISEKMHYISDIIEFTLHNY